LSRPNELERATTGPVLDQAELKVSTAEDAGFDSMMLGCPALHLQIYTSKLYIWKVRISSMNTRSSGQQCETKPPTILFSTQESFGVYRFAGERHLTAPLPADVQ